MVGPNNIKCENCKEHTYSREVHRVANSKDAGGDHSLTKSVPVSELTSRAFTVEFCDTLFLLVVLERGALAPLFPYTSLVYFNACLLALRLDVSRNLFVTLVWLGIRLMSKGRHRARQATQPCHGACAAKGSVKLASTRGTKTIHEAVPRDPQRMTQSVLTALAAELLPSQRSGFISLWRKPKPAQSARMGNTPTSKDWGRAKIAVLSAPLARSVEFLSETPNAFNAFRKDVH